MEWWICGGYVNSPSEANSAAVTHAIAKDLAGQDGVAKENGTELLQLVSTL